MNINKTSLIIIGMLLALNTVFAIGIMPAKSTHEGTGTASFDVVNTERLDMIAYIEVEGDAAEFITPLVDSKDFKSDENRKALEFDYRDPPFQVTGWIVVRQVPKAIGGQILPSIQVKHAVTLLPQVIEAAEPGELQEAAAGTAQVGVEAAPSVGVLGAVGNTASQVFGDIPRPEPNPPRTPEVVSIIVINGLLALVLVGGVRRLVP